MPVSPPIRPPGRIVHIPERGPSWPDPVGGSLAESLAASTVGSVPITAHQQTAGPSVAAGQRYNPGIGLGAHDASLTTLLPVGEVALHAFAAISDRMRTIEYRYLTRRAEPLFEFQRALRDDQEVCDDLRRIAAGHTGLQPGTAATLLFMGSLIHRGQSTLRYIVERYTPEHLVNASCKALGRATIGDVEFTEGLPVGPRAFAVLADPDARFGSHILDRAKDRITSSASGTPIADVLRSSSQFAQAA